MYICIRNEGIKCTKCALEAIGNNAERVIFKIICKINMNTCTCKYGQQY